MNIRSRPKDARLRQLLNSCFFNLLIVAIIILQNPAFAKSVKPASPAWWLEQIRWPGVSQSPQTKKQMQKKIVVAIIDTGVDINHPLLKNKLWINPKDSKNGQDDEKNGYVDDLHGWSFTSNKNDVTDTHGHGTHVAGIIATIAPQAQLMILKYYDTKSKGGDHLKNTVAAIRYATAMGAHIINYSGGGDNPDPDENSALAEAEKKGILVIAAAGNERNNSDTIPFYPADYELPNIVSVTATDQNQTVLPSSNYGVKSVDVAAPGKDILSAAPNGQYAKMTGTSQATAVATGVAALIATQSVGGFNPRAIIRQLTVTNFISPHLKNKTQYAAILDSTRALRMRDQSSTAHGLQLSDAAPWANSALMVED